MTMEKSNYNSFDVGRILMALCVVAIHTSPFTFTNIFADRIWSNLLSIAVPYFFLVSGFLYFSKLKKENYEQEKQAAEKFIRVMVRRYCVWSLIYLPIAIYEYVQFGAGWKGIIVYVKDFFLVGGHYFSGHLWFILSSIYGILIITILRRKIKEEYILCFAIACVVLVSFLQMILQHPEWINGSVYTLLLWIWNNVGIDKLYAGFIYLSIAMCIVKWNRKIPLKISVVLLLITFLLNVWFSSVILHYMIEILFFEAARGICLPDNKYYLFLRRSSAVVYYAHLLFVFAWAVIKGAGYGGAEYRGIGCFLFVLVVAALMCVALNWLLYKNIGEKYIKLLL